MPTSPGRCTTISVVAGSSSTSWIGASRWRSVASPILIVGPGAVCSCRKSRLVSSARSRSSRPDAWKKWALKASVRNCSFAAACAISFVRRLMAAARTSCGLRAAAGIPGAVPPLKIRLRTTPGMSAAPSLSGRATSRNG